MSVIRNLLNKYESDGDIKLLDYSKILQFINSSFKPKISARGDLRSIENFLKDEDDIFSKFDRYGEIIQSPMVIEEMRSSTIRNKVESFLNKNRYLSGDPDDFYRYIRKYEVGPGDFSKSIFTENPMVCFGSSSIVIPSINNDKLVVTFLALEYDRMGPSVGNTGVVSYSCSMSNR